MKKILSKEQCNSILNQVQSQEWQRIDFHCRYDQTFIEDSSLVSSFQEFFGKEFNSIPIMKVLRLQEGDGLPLYSGDYDSVSDDAFKRYHGTNFIKVLLPEGVPFMIALILIPIELISYFSRVLSLSIRLFANMLSGHTLLKILLGFS